MANQYFYVTFHSKKNVFRYKLDGSPAKPEKKNKVLDSSEGLHGLRGMFVHNDELYVANSYKHDSKILKYGPADKDGRRTLKQVITKFHPTENPGLHHPYAIALDNESNLYASNQNTNTVTKYFGPKSNKEGSLHPVTRGLEGMQVHPGTFLFRPLTQNTNQGPLDQGIRGLAFDPKHEYLFIAHKYENCVFVYNKNGLQLNKEISVKNPIGVYLDQSILYIGSHTKENPKVVAYDTENWKMLPIEFVHPRLIHPAGIVTHGDYLYIVSMGDRSLLQFEKTGKFVKVLIQFDKNDDPEHVIIVNE